MTVCGARLHGGISVSGTTGQVNIGGAVCATGNAISGSVSLTANTGGVTYSNNTVTGSVTITNNSGGFTYAGKTAGGTVTLSNNTLSLDTLRKAWEVVAKWLAGIPEDSYGAYAVSIRGHGAVATTSTPR